MASSTPKTPPDYRLEDQVGYLLRQVNQRHVGIFMALIPGDLTPTQFSVIAMLRRIGSCSQNQLGRLVSMDAATVKGVIGRLSKRGITTTAPDPSDGRLLIVSLTEDGIALAAHCIPEAQRITGETLAPLDAEEQTQLIALLQKLR